MAIAVALRNHDKYVCPITEETPRNYCGSSSNYCGSFRILSIIAEVSAVSAEYRSLTAQRSKLAHFQKNPGAEKLRLAMLYNALCLIPPSSNAI